jgi:hypothetical protein
VLAVGCLGISFGGVLAITSGAVANEIACLALPPINVCIARRLPPFDSVQDAKFTAAS